MRKVIIWAVIAHCSLLLAQSDLNVSIDLATFKYDDTQTYTDIYYAIPSAGLVFNKQDDGSLKAEVVVRLDITQSGEPWRADAWRMEKVVTDSSEISEGNRMVDVVRYLMEEGTYSIVLSVEDVHDASIKSQVEKSLKVDGMTSDKMCCSDIVFAHSINKSTDTQDVFYKNGFEVIPNTSAIYGAESPVLFFYLESYNLPKSVVTDNYKTTFEIYGANDQKVENITDKAKIKNLIESTVEVGTVNVSAFYSGAYTFKFIVMDGNDHPVAEKEKKFFVYNPDVGEAPSLASIPVEEAVAKSEFAVMPESVLDDEFAKVEYIAAKEERSVYKNLQGEEGKRLFLFKFWQGRNPNPQSSFNPFRAEYLRRVEWASQNFKSYTRGGWKTDRGRVYILYGKPSDVEYNPNNPTSYAHEIWHYDTIEGGVIFVFVDFQEFGEFQQIHSSKIGETMDSNWEQVILK